MPKAKPYRRFNSQRISLIGAETTCPPMALRDIGDRQLSQRLQPRCRAAVCGCPSDPARSAAAYLPWAAALGRRRSFHPERGKWQV